MKTSNQKWLDAGRFFSLLGVVLMLAGADQLFAQFQYKWITIGRLHTAYSEAGALREEEADTDNQLAFPALEYTAGNKRAEALWIGAENYTDEDGTLWPFKIAHVGPRTGGAVQFFKRAFKLTSRFEPPVVTVKGDVSFRYWSVVDEIDPTMKADRMVYNRNVNRVGIQTEQNVYAFDQEFHDNYHIIEYTFTNVGDVNEEVGVDLDPVPTLENVYFFWIERYGFSGGSAWITGAGAPWGQYVMNDAVGDGHEDYGVDFTAQYAWAGYNPDQSEFSSLGQPMWYQLSGWLAGLQIDGDSLGRLDKAHFGGRVYIHADMAADDETNAADDASYANTGGDPLSPNLAGRQPSTLGMFNSDHADLVEDETDASLMIRQYTEHMATGRAYPHHADIVEPDDDGGYTGQNFATPTTDPSDVLGIHDMGGWQFVEGYGPYTMEPGDDVRLVLAEGAAGLSDSAKLMIGIDYKASDADDAALIEWKGESMTKNEWVLTSKDSIFQMFERAIANYESGFNIPRAPMPPCSLIVTSPIGAVHLRWVTYTGESDPYQWEIWRTTPLYQNSAYYEKIATLDGSAREYLDAVVNENGPVVGIEQFYYLIAIGDVNTDATGLTPTGVRLKSNRYYTQTYFPVQAARAPGEELDDFVIVPNPYHIGAAKEIRYPDVQDKLGFLDIPGYCTIKIYTQLGELVDTIEHAEGTGDVYWDHTTASRQVVASGLYIAVVTDNETNKKLMKKFVIIR